MTANSSPASFLLCTGLIMMVAASLFAATPSKVDRTDRFTAGQTDDAGDLAVHVRTRLEARLPELVKRVQVEQRDGVVVLTGVVDSLPKKQIADDAARSVRGVTAVENQLVVETLRQPDEEIKRFVETALKSDPATLALDIDVSVREGVVTLHGNVDTVPQKRIAAWVASGLVGVNVVSNQIEVRSEARRDSEIQAELQQYYRTDPIYDDDDIRVQVENGIVTISGQVDSALEKNWAQEEAWVRGVRRVNAASLRVYYTPSLSHAGRVKPLTDGEIRQAIMRAYVYDPRVASVNPEVKVDRGVVTLQGVISNRKAKQAAVQIARNVGGVVDVLDRMSVQPDAPREDEEIRHAVLSALRTSAALARNELAVEVENGRVKLTGTVDSGYEQWVAEDLADRTQGVVGVENKLLVRGGARKDSPPDYTYPRGGATTPWLYSRSSDAEPGSDADLVAGVRAELSRSVFTDGDGIRIEAKRGVVMLAGTVRSWAERGAVVEAAYQAGAVGVVNRLHVRQQP